MTIDYPPVEISYWLGQACFGIVVGHALSRPFDFIHYCNCYLNAIGLQIIFLSIFLVTFNHSYLMYLGSCPQQANILAGIVEGHVDAH